MDEQQGTSHRNVVDAWFETERNRLWVFLRSRVGSESDADDLAQTVYLKMVGGTFAAATNLDGWAFSIANHAVCDHFRGKKRRPSTFIESDTAIQDNSATPMMQLLATEESQRSSEILRHCLAGLSKDELVVMQARILGNDHATIAVDQGWGTANRSEKTFHRAKRKLQDCIRSKRGDDENS